MASRFCKIPAPNTLVVFEASARHLSFTRAAQELNLSQAAVSKQVANLEQRLGSRLFERRHRALLLTPEGRTLFDAVTEGLGHILGAIDRLSAERTSTTVTISATTAFAQLWLLPRLAQFRQHHPGINLRLLTSDDNRAGIDSGADIAVKYGNDSWHKVQATRLLANEILPVCSPALLQGRHTLSLAELLHLPLIDLDADHWRWIHWHPWLLSQQCRRLEPPVALTFNNIPMLYQAALEGQGVALGWSILVQDLLADGRLIAPCAERLLLPDPWGYYLLLPLAGETSREVGVVRRWILESSSAEQAGIMSGERPALA